MSEVPLELGSKHLIGCRLDVVFDALELETLLVRVVEGVTRPVVVIPRLTDRADAHDVLAVRLEVEVDGRELFDARRGESEHLAEMRMADERDVTQLIVERQALARLLRGENVLEFLEPNGRAVTELDAEFVETNFVRQRLEPAHVFFREQLRV